MCLKRLRFEGVLKVVEKNWESEPSLLCLSCVGISHDYLGEGANRATQCVIYVDAHKDKDHRCGVIGSTVKISKISTQIILKYINCDAKYKAIAFRYPARFKAQAEVCRKKSQKLQVKNELLGSSTTPKEEPETISNEMEEDNAYTPWMKNL